MSLNSRTIKTSNLFVCLPPHQHDRIPPILYFITGNPGLIGYYHQILALLCQSSQLPATNSRHGEALRLDHAAKNFVVAGFSLGGFDLLDDTSTQSVPRTSHAATLSADAGASDQTDLNGDSFNDVLYPPDFQKKQIYGLRDQIGLCHARLKALVAKVQWEYTRDAHSSPDKTNSTPDNPKPDHDTNTNINVILMGHSVGAYIALELQRLHHHTQLQDPPPPSLPSSPIFTITSTILLTPTIQNIAHSPSGRLATPLLNTLPFLPGIAQLASSGLTSLLPASQLRWLVSKATGMGLGSDALDATVRLLGERGAVRQALFLARDEMREIDVWRWGEEVWGVVGDGVVVGEGEGEGEEREGREKGKGWRAPKLYFWFAKEDHWVADVTRDEIIAMVRQKFGEEGEGAKADGDGYRRRRPEVVVDEDDGLVHAWCIAQSELVARRVGGWLDESLREC